MARYETFKFYSYHWACSDEDFKSHGTQNVIRVYGFNEHNEPVYIRIDDFNIPIFISLPTDIEWDESAVEALRGKLSSMGQRKGYMPVSLEYVERAKSHYANVEKLEHPDEKGIKYKYKKFPFLKAEFQSTKSLDGFTNMVKTDLYVPGVGCVRLKCHATERTVTPVLKFLGIKSLPSCGWMDIRGIVIGKHEKETTRKYEYSVFHEDIKPMPEEKAIHMPAINPKILSFDLEANSSVARQFPRATRPGDKIFQLSYIISTPAGYNKTEDKGIKKVLLSLGNPKPIDGIVIKSFKTEADLLVQFAKDIVAEDPEVIIGFNIMGFDFTYIIDRCKHACRCLGEFDIIGCLDGKHCEVKSIKWASSGRGKQDMSYINPDGRVIIDIYPYVRKNCKLPNYRLETICDEYLKVNKDPLKAKDIFRCYRQFTPESLSLCGGYCVQDSYVVLLLFDKLNVWADLTETATVNNVPLFDVITTGEQIKMYSQVYKYCYHQNIVIESNAYQAKDDEHFKGAYVSQPIHGLHKKVVPLDFASMYPNTMRAYNFDYLKLVNDPSIPDEDCHIMEFSEHEYCGCSKDAYPGKKAPKMKDGTTKRMCADYKYRWLKEEISGRGILPSILETSLTARAKVREYIEVLKKQVKTLNAIISGKYEGKRKELTESVEHLTHIEIPIDDVVKGTLDEDQKKLIKIRIDYLLNLINILDRRQAAFKVNANSVYGACGAKKGYIPFLPIAMCVTFMGRTNINKVNEFCKSRYGATIIYNDTDSCYCRFPEFDNRPVGELWDHCLKVVAEIKSIFPKELSLEFEGKIYEDFLILTKKRYVCKSMNKDGQIDPKLFKRGVILQRRDNCAVLRQTYQLLIFKIFDFNQDIIALKELPDINQAKTELVALNKSVKAFDKFLTRKRWNGRLAYKTFGNDPDNDYDEYTREEIIALRDEIKVKMAEKTITVRTRFDSPIIQKLIGLVINSIDSLFRWAYKSEETNQYVSHHPRDFTITKQITRDIDQYKDQNKLPSHVYLGLKMMRNGTPVSAGSRVEYVITADEGVDYKKTECQREKIEDIDYFIEFREILRLSYLDYCKQFINPIDELCEKVFGIKDVVKDQWNIRINYAKVVNQIKETGRPRILYPAIQEEE